MNEAAPTQTSSMPHKLGDWMTPAMMVRVLIVTVLVVLVYWGSIRHLLIARWLRDGNWSHGWLIPAFSLYFLWTKRDDLVKCQIHGSLTGAVVLVLSLTMFFFSAWRLRMGYPQALSIVGTIFGVTLLMGGWNIIRIAWFPILFLVLAIPLPDRLYVELTFPLRRLASAAAASIMPLLTTGLHTQAQAVVIDYIVPGRPPGTLNVEEACSGMRLMMAFVTLGVAMAYLGERPTWQRVIMILACLPIAVFCNTIRVTTTGMFWIFGYTEYAQGTAHQLLGILMLGIALGLYSLIGYVLNHLFVEVPEGETVSQDESFVGKHK